MFTTKWSPFFVSFCGLMPIFLFQLVNLKAELHRKQERFRQKKQGVSAGVPTGYSAVVPKTAVSHCFSVWSRGQKAAGPDGTVQVYSSVKVAKRGTKLWAKNCNFLRACHTRYILLLIRVPKSIVSASILVLYGWPGMWFLSHFVSVLNFFVLQILRLLQHLFSLVRVLLFKCEWVSSKSSRSIGNCCTLSAKITLGDGSAVQLRRMYCSVMQTEAQHHNVTEEREN